MSERENPLQAPWFTEPYRGVKSVHGIQVCTIPSGRIEEAQEAAHLIAAAPEMLEALEALKDAFGIIDPDDNEQRQINAAYDAASAAIKKARGTP